jgi:O-antigen biosynthesis protein
MPRRAGRVAGSADRESGRLRTIRGRTVTAAAEAANVLLSRLRIVVSHHQRLALRAQALANRVPILRDAYLKLSRGDFVERYSRWITMYDTLDREDIESARASGRNDDLPWLSLFVLTVRTDQQALERLIESICAQVYQRWDLTVLVSSRQRNAVADRLAADDRFRLAVFEGSPYPGWNDALRDSRGDYVVVLEDDVVLRPHSLLLFARTIAAKPETSVIYADEDLLAEDGTRRNHFFKPEWNEALLRGQNYFGGFACVCRRRLLDVGGFDDGDLWSLYLRVTVSARPGSIHRVPFVLSHRTRASVRPSVTAHRDRLARLGEQVEVDIAGERSFTLRYPLPERQPHVAVIVPSSCDLRILRPCIDGLVNDTAYRNHDVYVVANGRGAERPAAQRYLDEIAQWPSVQVLFYGDVDPYNYSDVNNWAVEHVQSEFLCFVNDDTEPRDSNWLDALVARALSPRVAAVGALLLFPNGRIQHAGVVLGPGGVAGHAYRGLRYGVGGYHDRALLDQDVSCVTAACMLIRRDVFIEIGGFDPKLAVAYNDVDLCLRLATRGWRIVWTPAAVLSHRESASFGRHGIAESARRWASESRLMEERWGAHLQTDPYYNPNLSLDGPHLWEPAFPPRVTYPWRAISVAETQS